MSHPFASGTRFRLLALFSATCALAACGGGGGGGDSEAPAAGGAGEPLAPVAYADCMRDPSGVNHTYLNAARPRVEWRDASFLGVAATARREFVSSSASTPTRVWYYRFDSTSSTVDTLGYEELDGSGNVTRREQYEGWSHSTDLAEGQTEVVNHTVRTLVPAGQADLSRRVTLVYQGNEVISLPGGRLNTCKVRSTIERLTGTTQGQESVETSHFSPGLGVVKSYYTPTLTTFSNRNQTYLTELASTSASLSLAAPNADAAPTLAQCSQLSPGQDLKISASSPIEANTASATIFASTFNGASALAVVWRNATSDARARIDYFDPAVGFLRYAGNEFYGSANDVLQTRVVRSGRPDLRSTPVLGTTSYTETFTVTVPANGGASASNDRFTFEGYAKVTTPAGMFDTCKVRFDYQDGLVETYYLAPNLYWVRLDATSNGVRATRELISR